MTAGGAAPGGLIWTTRGHTWGFRFLLDGGMGDPLATYERALGPLGDDRAGWCRDGGLVALRFPDPLGRRDAAGRVIPHEFVLLEDAGSDIESVEDGLERVWPRVEDAYARVWDADGPPSAAELFPS